LDEEQEGERRGHAANLARLVRTPLLTRAIRTT
jgi:hypothetical protein